MKRSIAIGLSLALCACNNTSDPLKTTWLGANPDAGPTRVGGSATNTTNAFDGTYKGVPPAKSAGGGSTGPKPAGGISPTCPQYGETPLLTVSDGLAQFKAFGVTFAGYVTPRGHLTMHSGYGATVIGTIKPEQVDEDFDGDFDTQTHTLSGKVNATNCIYNVTWQRV